MLSKKWLSTAVLALSFAFVHCSSRARPGERNFSFSTDRNLIVLRQAAVDGRPARVFLGTATPISLADPGLLKNLGPAGKNPIEVTFGDRYHTTVRPERADLAGLGDLLLGSDAFPGSTLVLDFKRGLISILRSDETQSNTSDLHFSPFRDMPAVEIEVNGQSLPALVDTANADTVTLPLLLNNGRAGRRKVDLTVAGTDLGSVDAAFANVRSARIGNRILQYFLIRIDYQHKRIALWNTSRGNE